tara:strand:+ start:94 stop:351 length:258 start_codon:yes stop_codon:yes gene_type:complete
MRYGTSYFPTLQDAIKYYAQYGHDEDYVYENIESGSISIGDLPPEMLVAKPGEYKRHAILLDENRFIKSSEQIMRWHIGVDIRIG